ncbi:MULTISPECIES: ROK family transcriptional regulator [unclassified Leifsonia]|uniref:ROK family transcriptional regulator n=1 Tax=unclassified Leifsonia TaxID=2663824 RepID=UPI000373891E|nr:MULTISPECIES: ROK family transcriptional regulator [unclassified Leifsonia]TDP98917.1 putative NBD/HSP70 family sugar kinase [Leifsonia sp. 115AMFTsu3.1]
MAKRTRATATTSTLARVNQTAIIEALRESGALSRQQLGAKTGLSPATINRLTASLIEDGLVVAAGQEPSTGGRPSVLLRYAGSSRLVAAIQLRAETVTGILVDFDGKIVFRRSVPLGARQAGDPARADAESPERATDQERQLRKVFRLFDDLIATADSMGTPCLAVGIAVPGVVQQPDGVVGTMPEFGWTGVPFGTLLRQRTNLPVVVENDANALAFGELHTGAGRGLSSLVALFLENGLGAGIVANGELHRGARAEAGEIGYLLMERSSLGRSYDARGDLEDRIGSLALTQRARERGIPIPDGGSLTAEDVFELARDGNADAQELADEILDMVAIAVAALVIVLDPELVVVGSSFVGSSDTVIPGIQERLRGRIIRVPRIEPATHREDAVLLGAAELAAAEVNGFAYLAF